MARSNVIIVGTVALAPLILGVESYALYRAHHHRAAPSDALGSLEMTAAPALGGPVAETPAVPTPAARPLAPPPPQPPAPAPEDPPPETETVSDVQPDPANARRRQLMLQRRGEILQVADEQVFGLLNVSDAQRAAIRAIDSAYARTLQAIGQLPQGADLQSAGLDPNADQARRAAIANVLGPDATHAFNFAERKAERHVRNQYRPEQVRGR
jgi:hypothetical protein